MKAKPILMHGRSIQNLLAGRKTQIRRIVKPWIAERLDALGSVDDQPATSDDILVRWQQHRDDDGSIHGPEWCAFCAEYPEEGCIPIGRGYGNVGDLLYVRETFEYTPDGIEYRATEGDLGVLPPDDQPLWRPSIHMPRWASRITLHLTDVRVERVKEISEPDAFAEGAPMAHYGEAFDIPERFVQQGSFPTHAAVYGFQQLWDDTNGAGAWDRNDWVWVLEFEVVHANVDAVLKDPREYGLGMHAA